MESRTPEPGTLARVGTILKALFITGPLLIIFLLRVAFAYFIGGHGRAVTKTKKQEGDKQ